MANRRGGRDMADCQIIYGGHMNGSGTPSSPSGGDDEIYQARLTPSEELHNYVRGWRERLNPGPGGRRPVSQEQMAYRIGVSVSYYGRLERGEQGNYSEDFLDKVAVAQQLQPDERTMLYQLATGRPPAPIIRPTNSGVDPIMELVIHALPWPAYISDAAWDVVVHNEIMTTWFPMMQYVTNVMRYVFCYPDARTQLIDWETSWAAPMLAQMKAAHSLKPNPGLAALIDEVLQQNDVARSLWDRPTVYVHPDGDRRRLYVPFTEQPQEIQIVALTPMRADDLRAIILYPVDEHALAQLTARVVHM